MLTPIAAAAEAMGIGVRSLTVQVSTGRYPGRRVDGRWYVPSWFVRAYAPTEMRRPARLATIEIGGLRLCYAFKTESMRRSWMRAAQRWAKDRTDTIIGLTNHGQCDTEDRLWSIWTMRSSN